MTVPGSSLGTEIWESSSQGKSSGAELSCLARGHLTGPGCVLQEQPALRAVSTDGALLFPSFLCWDLGAILAPFAATAPEWM